MKTLRIILSIILLAAAFGVSAQSFNEQLKVDQKIHDFGRISETGGKVSHQFRFTNTGRTNQVIVRGRAGCSCVSIDVPRQPIAPGKTGIVTVTFDPDYRPGHFSKEIVIFSGDNKYNRIWVKGDVQPGDHNIAEELRYDYGSDLYMNLKVMNFAGLKAGEEKTIKLTYGNNSKEKTMRLNFELAEPNPDVSVLVPSGALLAPQRKGVLPVTVKPLTDISSPIELKLVPIVNGNRLQPLTITVIGK